MFEKLSDEVPSYETSQQEKNSKDVRMLKEQLEAQSKVNSDLKKMLIASIGDDLHNKIEVLIRTKMHLTSEVDSYSGLTSNHLEHIDKLSIQADLWYSKYQAANLLIRQLSMDREDYLGRYSHCLNALQHVMVERQCLYQVMLDTYRLLSSLINNHPFLQSPPPFIGDTLELAHLSQQMASTLNHHSPHTPILCLPPTPQIFFTYAENLSLEALKSCKDESLKCNVASIKRPKLLPRYHPAAKYMGLVCNCCRKCKGAIMHV